MKNSQMAMCTAMSLALAACGGGGGDGGIVSTPPPPVALVKQETAVGKALPATPALTAGTYDVVGIIAASSGTRNLVPSDLAIEVASPDSSTWEYTLQFDPAVFPGLTGQNAPSGELTYRMPATYGHEYTYTGTYSDGTKDTAEGEDTSGSSSRDERVGDPHLTRYDSHVGASYASLGVWATLVDGAEALVAFAYGDRTLPGALPATGTATYRDVVQLSDYNYPSVGNITLTADFGASSITGEAWTSYSDPFADCATVACDDIPAGTAELSGTAPITNQGTFDIALSGTLRLNEDLSTAVPVNGVLGGAFFGPNAEQIGGYYSLPAGFPDDYGYETGAFVAERN